MEAGVVLKMQGICMTFPGVKALEGVDLTLKKGEIRALMGENGAGKSTLIKCLTGVNKFEAGEIYLEGFDHPIVNKDNPGGKLLLDPDSIYFAVIILNR